MGARTWQETFEIAVKKNVGKRELQDERGGGVGGDTNDVGIFLPSGHPKNKSALGSTTFALYFNAARWSMFVSVDDPVLCVLTHTTRRLGL
jgi:hypothetical protein